MSSYKKLSKADITTALYTANKQWNFLYPSGSLPPNDDNIIYYQGTKEDFNRTGSTTSRDQYKSLIYDSINHLFYQSYNDALNTGSLMFDVETYESASEQRPTSSYFNYNINPLLIKNFPTSSSSGILVLSINKNLYSNKILPHSFRISSSLFNIIDDGNGNLFHHYNCGLYELGSVEFSETFYYVTCSGNTYTTESLISTSSIRSINTDYPILTFSGSEAYYLIESEEHNIHVGNIFYAHGLVVITNQDYQNIIPPPPPPPSQSININVKGIVYEVVSNTGSVYYKVNNGSYTFLGNVYGTGCRDIGSFTVPTGSEVYIAVTSGSDNIGFSAVLTSSCDVPTETSFCGINNPFTASYGFFPISASITSSIGIGVKTIFPTNSFAVC